MDFLTSADFWILTGSSLVKTLFLIFAVVLPMVSYTVYAERRVSALIQDRLGPNRTGFPISLIGFKKDWSPFLGGLGQPVADAVKFLLKEDFVPAHVNQFYFWIAPALSMMPALVTLAAIPFGSTFLGFPMVVANINVGLLFMFAISSVSVYGIVLAGWSSNSKYPFLGGIRSTSQMISYELGMGLSAVPVILISGVDQPAQNCRIPDPEWLDDAALLERTFWCGENVALDPGYHRLRHFHDLDVRGNEPSAVRSSRIRNRTRCGIPHGIFVDEIRALLPRRIHRDDRGQRVDRRALPRRLSHPGNPKCAGQGGIPLLRQIPGVIWGIVNITTFFAKVAALLFVFIWIRWTLPRFRYDQLMKLGWLYIFEIALANIFLTAGILAFTH